MTAAFWPTHLFLASLGIIPPTRHYSSLAPKPCVVIPKDEFAEFDWFFLVGPLIDRLAMSNQVLSFMFLL
jgi:hypothetical protein